MFRLQGPVKFIYCCSMEGHLMNFYFWSIICMSRYDDLYKAFCKPKVDGFIDSSTVKIINISFSWCTLVRTKCIYYMLAMIFNYGHSGRRCCYWVLVGSPMMSLTPHLIFIELCPKKEYYKNLWQLKKLKLFKKFHFLFRKINTQWCTVL